MGIKITVTDKDLGWDKLFSQVKEIADARGMRVRVGVLDGDGGDAREEGSDLSVAEIAAVNEFGTEDGHIPERSFLRSTFDEEREGLADLGRELFAKILFDGMKAETALGQMGTRLASAVRDKIRSNIPPLNAPSTALRKAMKGRTKRLFSKAPKTLGQGLAQVGAVAVVKTLIDTGRLLGSITWALVKPGSGE
jgi:hypothetical protein